MKRSGNHLASNPVPTPTARGSSAYCERLVPSCQAIVSKRRSIRGDYQELEQYCRGRYPNYAIHRGYFEDVLSPEILEVFAKQLPILLWIDCDYYSSARTVMQRLLPFIPSGCVVYFDDYSYNYGSRLTGEARVVFELNRGDYGDNVELVPDRELGLDSNSVYRFIRLDGGPRYHWMSSPRLAQGRQRGNDSALP